MGADIAPDIFQALPLFGMFALFSSPSSRGKEDDGDEIHLEWKRSSSFLRSMSESDGPFLPWESLPISLNVILSPLPFELGAKSRVTKVCCSSEESNAAAES